MSDAPPPSSRPASRREDALTVVKRLRDAGHVAYFAGGCVRDLLLGLQPKDYDVATDAPPDKVRTIFRNTQAVGAAFGVILVRLGGSQIEVATFRADMEYDDGRHPVGVRFTSAEEDSKRRDFTINGLFLDPIEDRVIDYVDGQKDLQAMVIRAIGDPLERFDEDHLRMLRAIRFAARFGFALESKTEQAIWKDAPKLVRISPERIAEELRLMLCPTSRALAWKWLRQSGLCEVVFRFLEPFPETHANAGIPVGRSGAIFKAVASERAIPFGLALAAATLDWVWPTWPADADLRLLLDQKSIHNISQALRKSLKLSNEELDELIGTLKNLAPLLRDEPPDVATLKRFLASPTAESSRALLIALPHCVDQGRVQWLQTRLTDLEQTDYAPLPLITGDDLTAAGLRPGKLFKRILDDVYDAQLEDRIHSKDQAMTLALEIAKSAG